MPKIKEPAAVIDKLLADIKKLRNSGQFDEGAILQFDAWEKTAMSAIANSSLLDSDAIKAVVEYGNAKIEYIEQELHKKSVDLPDYRRDLLLIEQDIWKYLTSVFTGEAPQIAMIQQQITENIKEMESSRHSLH